MGLISKKWIVALILLAFAPGLVWISTIGYSNNFELSSENADWGAFGSYYGGLLSPIFTLLSVVILVFTFNETRKNNTLISDHLAREQRRQNIYALAEQLKKFMDSDTTELNHLLSAVHITGTVRKNLYVFNRDYKTYGEKINQFKFDLVQNVTGNAESCLHAIFDEMLLAKNDQEEQASLERLIWALLDFNDITELLNFAKKSVKHGKSTVPFTSPLLATLVELNKRYHYRKEIAEEYSKLQSDMGMPPK
jgi:uncharacterized membrane protein